MCLLVQRNTLCNIYKLSGFLLQSILLAIGLKCRGVMPNKKRPLQEEIVHDILDVKAIGRQRDEKRVTEESKIIWVWTPWLVAGRQAAL